MSGESNSPAAVGNTNMVANHWPNRPVGFSRMHLAKRSGMLTDLAMHSGSGCMSLSSSVTDYPFEYGMFPVSLVSTVDLKIHFASCTDSLTGRRYHRYAEGQYFMPNDEVLREPTP